MCSLGADDKRSGAATGDGEPLLSLRAAVILLAGLVVASIAGLLSFTGDRDLPEAVLTAGGAFGGATLFFNQLVGAGRS